MLESIIENQMINNLTSRFCRSPLQKNCIHESDSEIIRISEAGDMIAVTTDSISEEIETGLYNDPYLIGWMLVMVNFSDIAAVGAEPIGILISEVLPDELSPEFIDKIQAGIHDAVKKCGSYVLGGDTNSGRNLVLTACALGKSPCNKYLSRKGCKEGDILYSTGKAGSGNAYAISKLLDGVNKTNYLPAAKLKEAAVLLNFANCCIDTSDGLLAALDQLLRLNKCGFKLKDPDEIISESAYLSAIIRNIPPWFLLAGQHGDFELLFTISPESENAFLTAAEVISWKPVKIGTSMQKQEVVIDLYGKVSTLDTARLRNIPSETKGDVNSYLQKLIAYDNELRYNINQYDNSLTST